MSQYTYHTKKKGWLSSLNVYLRVYKLPRVIDPFSTLYQKLFCQWNHCSLQFDDIVVHFYDDTIVPKWVESIVDDRLSHPKEVYLIGETDIPLSELRHLTNALPRFTWKDLIYRYLSPLTLFHFPKKKNDCIHKCSMALEYIFNTGTIITSTPDHLLNHYKDYNASRIY